MEISNIKPTLHEINLLSRLCHNLYHHWIQTMMWFVHQPRQHVQLEWQMDNFEMETTKHNSMFAKDSHPFPPTHSLLLAASLVTPSLPPSIYSPMRGEVGKLHFLKCECSTPASICCLLETITISLSIISRIEGEM